MTKPLSYNLRAIEARLNEADGAGIPSPLILSYTELLDAELAKVKDE